VTSSTSDGADFEREIRLFESTEWWVATDVETGHTSQGATRDEARENLADAIVALPDPRDRVRDVAAVATPLVPGPVDEAHAGDAVPRECVADCPKSPVRPPAIVLGVWGCGGHAGAALAVEDPATVPGARDDDPIAHVRPWDGPLEEF